jgi:hypothetical protein
MVASDLTIPAHGGLPVFSTLRTPPPKRFTPLKRGICITPPERLQKEAHSQRLRIIPVNFLHPPARHSSRLGQRLQVALGAAAALAAISLSPASAQALVVTVGGVQYDVTTFTGSYDANTSKFALPPAPGVMPWWGSESLASQFAAAVGGNLPGSVPQIGPFFGWASGDDEDGNAYVAVKLWFVGSQSVSGGGAPTMDGGSVWAQVTPSTPPAAPAPGPLPLFGAAAAFGFSRKLRKRIKLAPGALGSSLPQA